MSENNNEKKPVASFGKTQRQEINLQNPQPAGNEDDTLTEDEQANIAKGLNKDGSAKAAPAALTEDQKKANLAAGLNEDGSAKTIELTAEQKKANLDKGLNEDGSAKIIELTAEQKKANLDKGLNEDGSEKVVLTADQKLDNLAKGLNEDGTARTAPLSKEQIEALHKREFPTPKELTAEEKKQAEDDLDKKRLDWFVAHGGTVDSYAAMKIVATSDLTQLSEKELEKELTDAGFNEEEKKILRAERYYQLDEEAIESLADEKEKELARKKRDFGTKKLNAKATHKQKLAVGFFENIDKALKAEADEAATEIADEKELAQKVDSHFQTINGKITLQMGKTADNVDIAPIELDADVTAGIIAEVKDLLKTTDKRNKFLYNEDGNLNIANLSEILIRNKVLEAAANKSYLKGVSDNTAAFEEIFPIRDRNALNITHQNGNNGKVKGKIASFGKSQRANMPATT